MVPLAGLSNEQPQCDHENGLVVRPTEKQTYETMWCGVWYDCPVHLCNFSRVEESASSLLNLLRWRMKYGRWPDWMYPDKLRRQP